MRSFDTSHLGDPPASGAARRRGAGECAALRGVGGGGGGVQGASLFVSPVA